MVLKLRSASYEDLRKVQGLSVMVTSLLSSHSSDQLIALAIGWLQHRYDRNMPIHTRINRTSTFFMCLFDYCVLVFLCYWESIN